MATAKASTPQTRGAIYQQEMQESCTVRTDEKSTVSRWRHLPLIKSRGIPAIPDHSKPSPEAHASLLSILTFAWIRPLLSVGSRRPLEKEDIYEINDSRSVEIFAERLKANLDRRRKQSQKYPFRYAFWDTFKTKILFAGLVYFIGTVAQFLTPWTVRFLVQYVQDEYTARSKNEPGPGIGAGLGWAFGLAGLQLVQRSFLTHAFYRMATMGGEAKAGLTLVIYEKAMKLSGRAKSGSHNEESNDNNRGWTDGKITSLMSTDTSRIDLGLYHSHNAWGAPLGVVITLILLLVNLGYSALPGMVPVIIFVPLLARTIERLLSQRHSINQLTEKRVALCQEIFSSMRFVKFFAWENSFHQRLNQIRKEEIRQLRIIYGMRNAVTSISLSIPVFGAMLTFITYSLAVLHGSTNLPAAKIFSSLALFISLRVPLNQWPSQLTKVVDAWPSIKRIDKFLDAEEEDVNHTVDHDSKQAFILENASFTWEETGKDQKLPFSLSPMNLSFSKETLTAVIGPVASGKSSLLNALAGEMRKMSGSVVTSCSEKAFCPQSSWIQNATLRQNVILDQSSMHYDKEWYDQIIEACALNPDIATWQHGDCTELGERGITVSGGQKARISLARAIYSKADLVLLDDPLSAVDSYVGTKIFDEAICGLLKSKCVIMATHRLDILRKCDRIILMESSDNQRKVKAVGTFTELLESSQEFRSMMGSLQTTGYRQDVDPLIDETAKTEKVDDQSKPIALMQEEDRATHNIDKKVWAAYFKASGTRYSPLIGLFLLCISQGSVVITSLWLSWWISRRFSIENGTYIGIYAALGVSDTCLMFLFSFTLSWFGTRASLNFHSLALSRIMSAPISFFDTTPLGRIIHRFSKDVDVMDSRLADAFEVMLFAGGGFLAPMILTAVYYPYFLIALAPLVCCYWFTSRYFRTSSREIKRIESNLRSHVYSRFSEGVTGSTTIRVFGVQKIFSDRLRHALNIHNSAYLIQYACMRWFSLRIDGIGSLYILVAGILIVSVRLELGPAVAGLVLSYVIGAGTSAQFYVRGQTDLEMDMDSVERLNYYCTKIDQEQTVNAGISESNWPETGDIRFENVFMRYRPGLPFVLKGFSLDIKSGQKVGIVGRTGTGKSTIMSALFRLTEIDENGYITISGKDIAKVDLHDLRSRMSIVPQDPTLFAGTIRDNIDPFSMHSDPELIAALDKAGFCDAIELKPDDPTASNTTASPEDLAAVKTDRAQKITLSTPVLAGGTNFSHGQRQLLALVRALVRDTKIIICDEATSAVDNAIDERVQTVIDEEFVKKGRTVLIIAHRLKTVLGCDLIAVVDDGKVIERGSPFELWNTEGSRFAAMCRNADIRDVDFAKT